ncbi:hypothetical protein HATV-3_gp29 [Haloarcula tailed virus 3]|uniref:Uncharacterized protein n=1 Tax=Haloarcula tailed virus 3 TaxID=2877990 RepID=A0AAE9BYW7_9CAUD|nr:hypothetical protein M1M35_gp29 [Haloarcula tailed virus 3]UBF23379.1 hypothetical protein HATV-3_gp29 [Haloarcula tailed virus 3]
MANTQAGNRPYRIEWIQETTEGEVPSDGDWNLFSDNIINAPQWEPDANTTRQDGAGKATAAGFYNGSETHEVTIEYDLQQWYVDGTGATVDAGGDFLEPTSDNGLKATHSIVDRSVQADGGADGAGRRIYTVIKGARPDTLTAPFETDDGTPLSQELAYQAGKIRQYDISQPSASTTLDVTNNGTTSVDVTIEDEGAATTETVTVAGGATETTTETFADIDAAELSTDTDGDVVVSDGSGTDLMTIKGSDKYPAGEGDLGVPALGSGSHASALNSDYIRFIDDTLSIPNVDNETEIVSGEMEVSTGLDSNAKAGTARQNIHNTNWEYTVTASLAGPRITVDQTQNYLTETTGTVTWTAQEGSIDFNDAFIQSPGEYTKESGNGKLIADSEFEAETITVSN